MVAPDASGSNQSPIVIYPEQVEYSRHLKDHPLQVRYDGSSVRTMQNTGSTVQIDVDGTTSSMSAILTACISWSFLVVYSAIYVLEL